MSHEEYSLEQLLVVHCAPSLMGVKPADLVSWQTVVPESEELPRSYTEEMARRGIVLRRLARRGGRLLVLVYRPDRLERWLSTPEVAAMLAAEGYPVEEGLTALLDHLTTRMAQEDFPHEVGLFLGYPPVDVEGFRRHQGRNCILSGPWKVYGQAEETARRFRTIRRCQVALRRRVEQGYTLAQLFPAV